MSLRFAETRVTKIFFLAFHFDVKQPNKPLCGRTCWVFVLFLFSLSVCVCVCPSAPVLKINHRQRGSLMILIWAAKKDKRGRERKRCNPRSAVGYIIMRYSISLLSSHYSVNKRKKYSLCRASVCVCVVWCNGGREVMDRSTAGEMEVGQSNCDAGG